MSTDYSPRTLNTEQLARWGNVQMMRHARHGLVANDGTFGGPEHCRNILRNCEAFIVTRPQPFPWEV